MAKVRAAYNYSYNYEGKKISFKKDEEFQLLMKSNKDWWQVRRWMDGSAQDIYVPAVYVKEVESTGPAVVKDQKDPTYMNLDDLKIPKPVENGTKGEKPEAPAVLNKPKPTNSFKKTTSLERNRPGSEKTHPSEDPLNTSAPAKTNGINLARPVSPSILRRLSNKDKDGPGSSSSLKRGEAPPPVSTKPRSKTNALETLDTSADAGPSKIVRQTSGGGIQGSKGKVPPPVQTKPKPQRVPVARPVSCMDMEGGEANNPIKSELSNLLLKKKPHLAGEHKPLTKSSSSGAVVESKVGEVPLSPTEEKVRTGIALGGSGSSLVCLFVELSLL